MLKKLYTIEAKNTGTKAFLYSPLVSESAYKSHAVESLVQKLYNGSVNLMPTSFIRERIITEADYSLRARKYT
jgi:BlaI family penicillinase repressor